MPCKRPLGEVGKHDLDLRGSDDNPLKERCEEIVKHAVGVEVVIEA